MFCTEDSNLKYNDVTIFKFLFNKTVKNMFYIW
jgi:hypothetical protein